jgi:hypothetical protein
MDGYSRSPVVIAGSLGILAINLCSSMLYSFAILAPSLKAALGLSQIALNVLPIAAFSSNALTPFYQTVVRGPTSFSLFTLLMAAVGVGSNLLIAWAVGGSMHIPYAVLVLLFLLSGLQQLVLFTLTVDVMSHHEVAIPRKSAFVVAVLPFGIGASIWPVLFTYAMGQNMFNWFILQAVTAALGCILVLLFKYSVPTLPAEHVSEPPPLWKFWWGMLWTDWTYATELVALFLAFGVALASSFNVGSIAYSVDPTGSDSVFLLTTAWGVGQLIGRLLASLFCAFGDWCVPARLLGSSLFVMVCLLEVCLFSLLQTGLNRDLLLLELGGIGVAYGAMWSVVVQVASADRHYHPRLNASLLGIAITFSCVMSHFLSNFVLSTLYDEAGHPAPDGSVVCVGSACFARTWEVFTAFPSVALVLAVVLLLVKCRRAPVRDELQLPLLD